MIRDADRLTGAARLAREATSPGSRDLPWPDGSRRQAIERSAQADDEPEGLDTMTDVRPGPARGIVLAFVPGLLVWGGLIAAAVRLLR